MSRDPSTTSEDLGQARYPKLVIYTAITGRISDELRLPVGDGLRLDPGIEFVCFTDRERYGTRFGPWTVRHPEWTHPSVPRRTARWHKAMACRLFPYAQYSMWCDGCFQLRAAPRTLIRFLEHIPSRNNKSLACDVATFEHPDRNCIYAEGVACIRLRKDDPVTIGAQMTRYQSERYPANNGLAETTCVLRRHTPQIALLGERWWDEMNRGSLRDQLSFDYCCHNLGIKYGLMGGCRGTNPHFSFYPHREL